MGRACSLLLICALAWAVGASAAPAQAGPAWSLVAWVCAEGDLSAAGMRYAAGLERAALANGWPMALQVDRGSLGRVRTRIGAAGDRSRERLGPAAMGSQEALAQFLAWAAQHASSQRRALVIYGHGPGTEASAMLAGDAIAVDLSSGDALTGAEVARAVAGSGPAFDLIALDCCHGARAEIAWALRASAEVLVASPSRTPSAGLPWEAVLASGALVPDGEELAAALLGAARTRGQRYVGIRPQGLMAVADAIAGLALALHLQGDGADAAVLSGRAVCRDWGPGRELCDMRELCGRLSAVGEAAVAVAARGAVTAIEAVTLDGSSAGPTEDGGLLAWMPGGRAPVRLDPDMIGDGFAVASGWAELVERCQRRQQELLRRTLDAPRRGRDAA